LLLVVSQQWTVKELMLMLPDSKIYHLIQSITAAFRNFEIANRQRNLSQARDCGKLLDPRTVGSRLTRRNTGERCSKSRTLTPASSRPWTAPSLKNFPSNWMENYLVCADSEFDTNGHVYGKDEKNDAFLCWHSTSIW